MNESRFDKDKANERTLFKKRLRKTFGLQSLRPEEEKVIQNVLNGLDTLAIMPTGAGKSLCYQLQR